MALLVGCSMERAVQREAEHPLADVEGLVNPATGREVIFVPMRHFGAAERFEATRRYLDTLKNEGWVIFHEGVVKVPYHIDTVNDIPKTALDTVGAAVTRAHRSRMDTLARKCRRMLGYWVGGRGYADSANLSLPDRITRRDYASQSNDRLGATTERDIWVDYTIADIVDVCEKKYGGIKLTEYDFRTGLYEKYEPEEEADGRMRSYFMLHARNDYVVSRIQQSSHPRIAVVYGSMHSFGIVWQLKSKHGFKAVKRYDAEEHCK